jgi:hypothetical protein
MDRLIKLETHVTINEVIPRFCDYECRFLGPFDPSSVIEIEYFCILFSESRKNCLILKNEHGHAVRCDYCLEKDKA